MHDPSKVVWDLAVSLALGGDCLADIAALRAEPGIYGRVVSDPTVSLTVDALAADAPAALKAIDAARAAAWTMVWGLAGKQAPDRGADAEHPLVVDQADPAGGRCRPLACGGKLSSNPAAVCLYGQRAMADGTELERGAGKAPSARRRCGRHEPVVE